MKKNCFKFIWTILFLIFLLILKGLPYFNLFLKPKLITLVISFFIVFLFSVPAKVLFKIALFSLLPAFIFHLTNLFAWQQLVGDAIYFLLFMGAIKKLNDL